MGRRGMSTVSARSRTGRRATTRSTWVSGTSSRSYSDRAGVDVLLVGHNHIHHRWAPQDGEGNVDPEGIRQFTVDAGGRSLYP